MSGKRQKLIASFATVSMVVTMMASTVYAIPARPFSDTGSDHWGFKDIIKMNARKVVSGYTNGTFQPNKPVSQIEAVLMAVHNMGIENQLSQVDTTQSLPFTVPLWAEEGNKKELLYAVEKGLIVPSENNFDASSNASRAWVTQLIVRMAGKATEAGQYSNDPVPVNDAASIPDWSAPYINVALKYNMASGYPDNTFKPNQSVTRAEMVSLLSRSEQFLNLDNQFWKGQIININSQNLTLSTKGAVKNISINGSTWIFDSNGKSIETASLTPDTPVSVLVEGLTVKYIEVLSADSIISTVKGTVLQILPTEKLISVKDESQKIQTFNLTAATLLKAQSGALTSLTQIKQGDQVEFNLNTAGNVASLVLLNGNIPDSNTGIIYNINLDQKLLVVKTSSGKYTTYQFDDQTVVKISAVRFPAMSDLQAGDEVKISLSGDILTEIELINASQELNLKGKVVLISTDQKIITLEKEDGSLQAFAINDQAKIVVPGQTTSKFSDIINGDVLDLKINQGVVTEITLQNRNYKETVKGTVVGVDTRNKIVTLKLEDGNLKAYEVDQAAQYEINGFTEISLSDVKKDMKVELRLTNNKIVYVTTKNAVEGSIVAINKSKGTVTINRNDTNLNQTYDLASKPKIYIIGFSDEDLDDIKNQDYAELVIDSDLVTKINIKKIVTYEITSVDQKNNKLKVKDSEGYTYTLTLDDNVDLVVPDLDFPTAGDFSKNSLINATYLGDTLTKIETTSIARGKVSNINIFSGVITIQKFDGSTSAFTFITNSQIKSNGNSSTSLSTVKTGDRVEIIENSDKTLSISVMSKLTVKYQSVSNNADTLYTQSTDGLYNDYKLAAKPLLHQGISTLDFYQFKRNDLMDIYLLDDTVYEVEKK